MLPVATPSTTTVRREQRARELRVSAYDNVAGLLLSLLILLSLSVLVLFVIWLSSRVFAVPQPVPVVLEDVGGGGREDGSLGESLELEAPDAEAIAREADLPENPVEKTLALVEDAISLLRTELDDPLLTQEIEAAQTKSTGETRRAGLGSGGGTGNGRGPGDGDGDGSGPGGIPRHQRWVIYFQDGETLDGYARQLDFFGIELGVVSGGEVTYARQLAQPKPEQYRGSSEAEQRLYMSWRQGGLQQADQTLLQRAGIDGKGKIALQFYPAAVENQLAQLEAAFAGRHASQIRRTRFGVRGEPGRYEFFVIDQAPL